MSGTEVVIIGAGIGGLACAIACANQGFDVRLLEQADQIKEVGAGLQITPNGVRVLSALGLGDEIVRIGTRSKAVVLRDYRKGAQVVRLDLTRNQDHPHYYLVHRADLIDMLAVAARRLGVRLELGQTVRKVVDGEKSATVVLADGSSFQSDIIIGADGLHSQVRTTLNGNRAPFFTGQVAWRALVPDWRDADYEVSVHMGPGRHIVSYPLQGGKTGNIVAVEERAQWCAEGWNHPGKRQELLDAFSRFGANIQGMLEQVQDVNVWGLFRHPVATHWHGHHTAILGDAAHPTLPFLAQGANMALEDAWVLADCLKSLPLPVALASYQSRRRDRVVRVIEAANANARNYHLRNPLIRTGAHLALRTIGAIAPGKMLKRFDWIYGHDVTKE